MNAEEFAQWEQWLLEITASWMVERGEIPPLAHLICRNDLETGEPLEAPRPYMIPCMFPMDKDRWTDLIRGLAMRGNAIGCAMVNEAWALATGSGDELNQAMEQYDGDFSKHPDRIEQVIILTEHAQEGRKMWLADIIREGDTARLSEFACHKEEKDSTIGGRFTHIIPNAVLD